MKFIQWLKGLFNREKEKMSDQSVTDTTTAAQPVAVSSVASQPEVAQPAAVEPAENAGTGVSATAELSPLEQAKAKFDAFVEFVEHGLEVLGKEAEADLVALKDKFL